MTRFEHFEDQRAPFAIWREGFRSSMPSNRVRAGESPMRIILTAQPYRLALQPRGRS